MDDILLLITKEYKWIIGIIGTLLGLYFTYKRLNILSNKQKIDIYDFNNKKPNFSIYINQGYRLFDEKKQNFKYLLFSIDILNKSTLKTTLTPYVLVKIKNQANTIILQHNKDLFLPDYHKNIDKLDNNINIEERGKKTGWVIFELPTNIIDKRVEFIEIMCQDSLSNNSKTRFYLLRDIFYDNKNNR